MRNTSIAAALIAALGAATAHAAPEPQLEGSDTLNPIMENLLGILNIPESDMIYIDGGSSSGEGALERNEQELAPMSRFLDDAACGAHANAGCWVVAKDSIAVVGNDTVACEALKWSGSITVQDLNGVSGIQCAGCSGSTFTFSDWRTVLRIVFAGQSAATNGTKDCNSDIRHTLVANWGNLFQGGCSGTSCTTLRHAYRRDDLSGTTGEFLRLLQLPELSTAPFCNGTEVQDNDPIRRSCEGNGFGGDGDEVCGFNDNLGLVLPTLIPQSDPYGAGGAPATQNCGQSVLGGAAFGDVAWTLADIGRYGSACPNGIPPVGGTCKWPKRAGTAGLSTGFGCVAGRNDRPNGSPLSLDARRYNLWTRNNDGTVVQYLRNGVQNQRSNISFYRKHQIAGCRFETETEQIGCEVNEDPCSTGFAGVSAITQFDDVIGIGLRSTSTPFEAVFPTEEDAPRYGLARDLHICTIDDFANTGSQSSGWVDTQMIIRDALTDSTPQEIAQSVAGTGFFPLPGNAPLPFNACP